MIDDEDKTSLIGNLMLSFSIFTESQEKLRRSVKEFVEINDKVKKENDYKSYIKDRSLWTEKQKLRDSLIKAMVFSSGSRFIYSPKPKRRFTLGRRF